MDYIAQYLDQAAVILNKIDQHSIHSLVGRLAELRDRHGRLFLIGVGGGAGHASHAVCDFRKIAHIEAYSASENVSELTARVNDDGWDTCYAEWLRGCRLTENDMVFVFSVGGGDVQKRISSNLVRALQYARQVHATICGVVGRDGGYTAKVTDNCVIVPVVDPATVTPHTETFQALVWHLVVSHPLLKASEMKWEAIEECESAHK